MVISHQSTDPDFEIYLMTNVLLASAMALRYGRPQSQAVKKAAKAMRDQSTRPDLQGFSRQILKANPAEIRDLVKRLQEGLLREGLIHTSIGENHEPDKASAVLRIQ